MCAETASGRMMAAASAAPGAMPSGPFEGAGGAASATARWRGGAGRARAVPGTGVFDTSRWAVSRVGAGSASGPGA